MSFQVHKKFNIKQKANTFLRNSTCYNKLNDIYFVETMTLFPVFLTNKMKDKLIKYYYYVIPEIKLQRFLVTHYFKVFLLKLFHVLTMIITFNNV